MGTVTSTNAENSENFSNTLNQGICCPTFKRPRGSSIDTPPRMYGKEYAQWAEDMNRLPKRKFRAVDETKADKKRLRHAGAPVPDLCTAKAATASAATTPAPTPRPALAPLPAVDGTPLRDDQRPHRFNVLRTVPSGWTLEEQDALELAVIAAAARWGIRPPRVTMRQLQDDKFVVRGPACPHGPDFDTGRTRLIAMRTETGSTPERSRTSERSRASGGEGARSGAAGRAAPRGSRVDAGWRGRERSDEAAGGWVGVCVWDGVCVCFVCVFWGVRTTRTRASGSTSRGG